jgi:hypothetical protein
MSRAATSRLKMNPQLGSPPSLEFRMLAELQVDESYQRSLDTEPSQRLIRRIAQFWDWGLCQPLAVARRQDGSLVVVDGQHRLAAARMRGDIAHLPCVITAYANAGDEAAAFVALNQNRKPLQPLDIFKAAVTAEDETAIAVKGILERAGLRLAPHTNWPFWKPRMLANVNALQACYRKHGETVLLVTLGAIAKGFPEAQLRFAGTIFGGLVPLVWARITKYRDVPAELSDQLGEMLRGCNQAKWMELSREEYVLGFKWKEAVANVFTRAFNRRLDELAANATATLPAVQPSKPLPISTNLAPSEMAWCSQCDQRVSGAKAEKCTSQFCSLKVKAA